MATALRVFYRIAFVLASLPGLRALLGRFLRPVAVVEHATEGMVAHGTLFGAQTAVSSHTQEWGKPFVQPAEATFPDVGWRVFDAATIVNSRQFPFLVTGHQMMVGHRHRPGPWTVVKKGNTVTLLPANARLEPMPFHPNEVVIYGRVVTVLRTLV